MFTDILSPTTSLLLLFIVFHYQMFPQLWQLEFKAFPLQQSVSLEEEVQFIVRSH
jgi:hypothetical protein